MESLIYECRDREYLKVRGYNLTLVNFEKLTQSIYLTHSDLLSVYNISNYTSKDSVKLLYHSVVMVLCEFLKNKKIHGEVMIYFNTSQDITSNKQVELLLNRLPCGTVFSNVTMCEFLYSLYNKNHTVIEKLEQALSLKKDPIKRFRKFRAFLKKYELLYMIDTYFKQHYNKMTLFG